MNATMTRTATDATSAVLNGDHPDRDEVRARTRCSDLMRPALSITHTHETGTVLEGTTRNDGTAGVLKAHGWRWSPRLGAWYVPRSRDVAAKRHVIERTAGALRAAGHDVEVLVDDAARPVDVVEADLSARQEERAARLDERAQRAAARAATAEASADAAGARLPEGGEPIKIGHHSEARHRRDIERAHRAMRASIDADTDARRAAEAAQSAAHATGARHNPVTVANRIARLDAELRRAVRARDGYTRTVEAARGIVDVVPAATGDYRQVLEAQIAQCTEAIEYWTSVRTKQQADGVATAYTKATVHPGDAVKIRGQWRRVVRSNTKTVSVETGYSWTDRAPWAEVQDHKPRT